jgi:RimJ/RimL family protein N-acetyltransferase
VAFVISDDQQGNGIAGAMLRLLADVARRHDITRLVASVLPDNHRMLHVFDKSGWVVARRFVDGALHIVMDIGAGPGSAPPE